MVYESDFYTTRRPYRPSSTYSSLSLSPLTSVYYLSSLLPFTTYHDPYIAYIPRLSQAELIYRPTARSVTRLVTYPEAPHHVVRVRVRPSVVLRELDRINYRHRPQHAVSALDEFYKAESTKLFEDEKRRIRADTESLLARARSIVPRAKSLAPLETLYTYSHGEPIPYRFSNDAYVASLPPSLRSVVHHINNISFYKYQEPPKKFTGRGHLACVHYSGNKAFSSRRPLYKEMSIRDDVNLLSFYAKNRLAAAGMAGATVKLQPWRPSRKFQAPKTMDDPSEELKAAKAEREARFRATTAEPVLTPAADLAEIKRKRQEEARAAEEKALKEEAKREAERKAQAEREAAEKKRAEDEARKAEEAKRKAEEDARKAEEEAKKAEEARLAEEAKKAEEARLAEEARIAEEARLAEEAKKAEEAKIAEEARLVEEARLAEEAKKAEEARLAEEERQAETRRQEELARLEELERQAQDEREAELARQAAELAEIARQESELAAARLEELSHSGSAAEVPEAEPEFQDAEPVVEEPESPAVEAPAPAEDPAEASEDEQAEPDVTDEE